MTSKIIKGRENEIGRFQHRPPATMTWEIETFCYYYGYNNRKIHLFIGFHGNPRLRMAKFWIRDLLHGFCPDRTWI